MLDKLQELETRVSALIDLLGQKTEWLNALEEEKADLENRLKTADQTIESLERQHKELEQRIEEDAGRENEMRARLLGIIERIDRVESEIATASAEGNEA